MRGLSNDFGISFEEIYLAALESLIKAVKTYDESKKFRFYSYWKGVAIKSIFSYIQLNSYKAGAKAFAGAFSFDEYVNNQEGMTYGEIVGANDEKMSRDILISESSKKIEEFYNTLSPLNKKVFLLLLRDFDREEMAIVLGYDKRSLYNRITLLRKKFENFLKKK